MYESRLPLKLQLRLLMSHAQNFHGRTEFGLCPTASHSLGHATPLLAAVSFFYHIRSHDLYIDMAAGIFGGLAGPFHSFTGLQSEQCHPVWHDRLLQLNPRSLLM